MGPGRHGPHPQAIDGPAGCPNPLSCIGLNTLATVAPVAGQRWAMNDESKLVAAFLALNLSVVALVVAAYQKSGMDFGAVLSHLRG